MANLNLYSQSILSTTMRYPDTTGRISVDLMQSEVDSILAILRTYAEQEHQQGNIETAEEIQRLHVNITRQL